MRRLLPALILVIFLLPAINAESLQVEKIVENKDIKVGNDVRILLKFTNPFGIEIPVKIVDKNIFGNNGLDVQCLEYTVPAQKEVTIAYDPIKPFKAGKYTLDAAEITYTNPETGEVEKVRSNTPVVEVKESGVQNEQQEGITTIYRCNGVNMQTVSYSSGGSFNINIGSGTQTGSQVNGNVQNNQLNQNTNVLKQQIEKQKQLEKEFQENIGKNREFQEKHEQLIGQGYNLTNASYVALTNNTGSFELEYKKPNGKAATMKGEMDNGTLKNLMVLTDEEKEEMLQKLQNEKVFQRYNRELVEQGFNRSKPLFNQLSQNHTEITVPYIKGDNEAKITAEYINGTIRNVKLDKKNEENGWWWYLLLIPLIGIIGYVSGRYFRYFRNEKNEISEIVEMKPIDFAQVAKEMLSDAERLFSEGRVKDAFEKVSQAIRYYYSSKLELRKEITAMELLKILEERGERYDDVRDCLDLCSSVEFAKYRAVRADFDKVLEIAKRIMI